MSLFIGEITRLDGDKGELLLQLKEAESMEFINTKESLFFIEDDIEIPLYFSTVVRKGANKVIILLEGFELSKFASSFVGKKLFAKRVDAEALMMGAKNKKGVKSGTKNTSAVIDLGSFVGFTLFVTEGAQLSIETSIVSVVDIKANPLFIVNWLKEDGSTKELMLPINEAFIDFVDADRKIINYNAPLGLLDIFIG